MRRLNRKELIEDFEQLRQGFRDVLDFVPMDAAQRMSFAAYHRMADNCVVKLGGKSIFDEK